MLDLKFLTVGSWQSNCYLVSNPESGNGILIDPGDEADKIIAWVGDVKISTILLTHGDHDHVGALPAVLARFDVPVGIHPADARQAGIQPDQALENGLQVPLDEYYLGVVHLPGHTPGSIALQLIEDGRFQRVVVGDAIFPGGPGHTSTPADLRLSLESLEHTVFTWSDATELYPGHGVHTTVGAERAAFEAFRAQPLPPELCGDVAWR